MMAMAMAMAASSYCDCYSASSSTSSSSAGVSSKIKSSALALVVCRVNNITFPFTLVRRRRRSRGGIIKIINNNNNYIYNYGSSSRRRRRRRRLSYCYCCCCSSEEGEEGEEEDDVDVERVEQILLEQPGGKMVAQLVGAFNHLTHRRIKLTSSSSRSSPLLFHTLKLAIPILNSSSPHARSPLSRALSVAVILADLQMDAQVISAGILTQVVEAGAMSLFQIRDRIGSATTAHLLHDCLRLHNNISSKLHLLHHDGYDDRSAAAAAAALRKFYLTYYDFRALIIHLALKLDTMRHLHYLPRYQQLLISLEVIKIHAPLAHALDTYTANRFLSLELEDLSFRYLFPHSYLYVDSWLRSHEMGTGTANTNNPLVDTYRDRLLQSLSSDPLLTEMVDDISVIGRYKSRYSTMKKLLRDGRKPEEVNDIFGLRVILSPSQGNSTRSPNVGEKACYRTREIVRTLWKEIPTRSKDYIANPKTNGYKSLHMAVDISDTGGRSRPPMEIQIRTVEMDRLAADGTASHALYKSGLTDPEEAKRLKAIMIAAAELAAFRLQDLPSTKNRGFEFDRRDQVFSLLDKNNDGKISIEELMEVMEELGAQEEDAREMMMLLDSNSDGSLSSDEFDLFEKQVELMRNLDDKDDQYKTLLDEKLQISDSSGFIEAYT